MNGSRVINVILERERLKAGTFAKNIGITPTQVYDVQKGKIQNISSKVAQKILNVYPYYSYSWLVTGEGEMLKSAPQSEDKELERISAEVELKEAKKQIKYSKWEGIQEPRKNQMGGFVERLNLLGYETPKEESGYKTILADILNRVASNPLAVAEQITGVKQQPAISEEMVNMITKPLLDRLSHEARRTAELEAKVALMEMSIAK